MGPSDAQLTRSVNTRTFEKKPSVNKTCARFCLNKSLLHGSAAYIRIFKITQFTVNQESQFLPPNSSLNKTNGT